MREKKMCEACVSFKFFLNIYCENINIWYQDMGQIKKERKCVLFWLSKVKTGGMHMDDRKIPIQNGKLWISVCEYTIINKDKVDTIVKSSLVATLFSEFLTKVLPKMSCIYVYYLYFSFPFNQMI